MKEKIKGITLLGNAATSFPEEPSASVLETFPNRNPDREYWVKFDCSDFTSLCPVTGQPDFARIEIRYIPDKLCVELKSVKLYMWSYRDEGAFHEDVTNKILDDIVAAIKPRWLEVIGHFNVRGGIATDVTVRHGRKK